jgi:hypothetical protein
MKTLRPSASRVFMPSRIVWVAMVLVLSITLVPVAGLAQTQSAEVSEGRGLFSKGSTEFIPLHEGLTVPS